MVLSDNEIMSEIHSGHIIVYPLDFKNIQPASYDFHLGDSFLTFDGYNDFIDPSNPPLMARVDNVGEFILGARSFCLGATLENLTVPSDLVVQVNGKSSLARLGLLIHITSGFVDPGWSGCLTLELYNVTRLPIILTPGMKIGQFVFMKLSSPAQYPYGHPKLNSKYKGSIGPTASKFNKVGILIG